MELKVYAIKDVCVGSFKQPFYLKNDKEATRAFINYIRMDKDANVIRGDLQLFRLGTYDDELGLLVSDLQFLVAGGEPVCGVETEE